MSAAERVPLLAASSARIAATLERGVVSVDPESLVVSTSGRRDDAAPEANTRRGRWLAVAALTLGAAGACAAVVGANGGVFSALGDAARAPSPR